MQGIVSVTSEAAKSLGVDSITGSLEPQKEADIIVVDGNPAENIQDLWKVADVFLAGQRVDRGPGEFLLEFASTRQHPEPRLRRFKRLAFLVSSKPAG